MATFKSVKGVSHNFSGLSSVLDYVSNSKNGEKVSEVSGYNCSTNTTSCYQEFIRIKELHDKTDGRQYRHHIQSFKPGEVTAELAHQIGVEFVEKNYKGYQVLIATHVDKEHIHNHFIINSVEMETGAKIRELSKKEMESKEELKSNELYLENLKKSSDELCNKYSLSVIDRQSSKKSLNLYDKKKYYAIQNHNKENEKGEKQESNIVKIALLVRKATKIVTNKNEFIKFMKENKVVTNWLETRKHITFELEDVKGKNKFRLENLRKTFNEELFTKEKLELSFKNNFEKQFKIKNEKIERGEEKQEIKNESKNSYEKIKEFYLEKEKEKKEKLEKEKVYIPKKIKSRGMER